MRENEREKTKTEVAVREWLLRYAWCHDDPAQKEAAVDCIMSQDGWKYLDARAEQYDGAQDPDARPELSGEEWALSALYECHDGPHLATCPFKHEDEEARDA